MQSGEPLHPASVPGELATPARLYQVVPASWRDLGSLRQLEQVCFPEDAWPLWDLIGVLTFPNMVRLKAVTPAAQGGEAMVGFIAGEVREKDGAAWISTVGVLPDYRRRGIGRALLAACEAQIQGEVLRLCVRVSNAGAQQLYREAGYTVREVWRQYYRDREDALVMQKFRPSPGLEEPRLPGL